jgi:hypothetical protein
VKGITSLRSAAHRNSYGADAAGDAKPSDDSLIGTGHHSATRIWGEGTPWVISHQGSPPPQRVMPTSLCTTAQLPNSLRIDADFSQSSPRHRCHAQSCTACLDDLPGLPRSCSCLLPILIGTRPVGHAPCCRLYIERKRRGRQRCAERTEVECGHSCGWRAPGTLSKVRWSAPIWISPCLRPPISWWAMWRREIIGARLGRALRSNGAGSRRDAPRHAWSGSGCRSSIRCR